MRSIRRSVQAWDLPITGQRRPRRTATVPEDVVTRTRPLPDGSPSERASHGPPDSIPTPPHGSDARDGIKPALSVRGGHERPASAASFLRPSLIGGDGRG